MYGYLWASWGVFRGPVGGNDIGWCLCGFSIPFEHLTGERRNTVYHSGGGSGYRHVVASVETRACAQEHEQNTVTRYVCMCVCMYVCVRQWISKWKGCMGLCVVGGQEGSGHRVATGQAVSGIRDLTCARAVAGCLREDCRNHQLLFTWVDEWVINRRCMWVDETRQDGFGTRGCS